MVSDQNYLVSAEVNRLFDPAKGNRNASHDRITSLHASQPSRSAASTRNSSSSFSCGSCLTSKDCRRHSSAKPERRVSGTHICIGRIPCMRNFCLYFCTRSRTLIISLPVHSWFSLLDVTCAAKALHATIFYPEQVEQRLAMDVLSDNHG